MAAKIASCTTSPVPTPPPIRHKRNFKALKLPQASRISISPSSTGAAPPIHIETDGGGIDIVPPPVPPKDELSPLGPGIKSGLGNSNASPSQLQPTYRHRTFKHSSISSTIASLSLSSESEVVPNSASSVDLFPDADLEGPGRGNENETTRSAKPKSGAARNRVVGAGVGGASARSGVKKVRITDVKDEQFRKVEELGQGNGGSVWKVEHTPSGISMARKVILIDAKPTVRKQIVRELQILHDCQASPYIITFYAAYLSSPNVCICMEFMDKGSFDRIYKKVGGRSGGGGMEVGVVQKVAEAVVEGLVYLYEVHRIIHRDIKPSNILCNSQGQIKLCDFGVSGELVNSIANTFVGTSTYMSPERIQGADYTIKSDVWSLGITIIEIAHCRFPFSDSDSDSEEDDDYSIHDNFTHTNKNYIEVSDDDNDSNSGHASRVRKRKSKGVSLHGDRMTLSILELMHHIVQDPPPRLRHRPPGSGSEYPTEAIEFVDACLEKDVSERKTPVSLLDFAWIKMAQTSNFDLKAWIETI